MISHAVLGSKEGIKGSLASSGKDPKMPLGEVSMCEWQGTKEVMCGTHSAEEFFCILDLVDTR